MYKLHIKSKVKNYDLNFTDQFKKQLQKYPKGTYFIIDEKVYDIFILKKIIRKNFILIKASEKAKEYNYISKIIDKLIRLNISKKDKIVSIGGGITQDITSFISMILFRGVDWHFFPTTLLAMGDSCIGSKLSVNFKNLKNQIGGYYPPSKIIIDISFLDTLSKRDIDSGVGELCHYYFVSGRKNFIFFRNNLASMFNRNKEKTKKMIFKTLQIKKKFIEKDEFDTAFRLTLNYGHTFGHAIESYFNYKIPHGIAVCIGMNISNYVSYLKKYITHTEFKEMETVLLSIKKDLGIKKIKLDSYIKILLKDKKVIGGMSRIILTKGLGKMFIKDIYLDNNFKTLLKKYKVTYN